MSKEQIRSAYELNEMSYGQAIRALISMGFTKFAADQYLYSE